MVLKMKLFVINLDRQPERRKRMADIFDHLGLQFTRVSAVDRLQLSADAVRAAGSLRPGETACFLSHRKCWVAVLEMHLPHAAIFEDDLHIGDEAASLLNDGSWIPVDSDVVKLETRLSPVRVDKVAAGVVGGRKLHRLRSPHIASGGYVVTRPGAEKLVSMSERFEAPVDQFMFNPAWPSAASLVTLQLVPSICVQDYVVKEGPIKLGIGSDLASERARAKRPGNKNLWRKLERPAAQLARFARRSAAGLLTDKRWVTVDFS
jgi:glycosyl transferase, family 25